MENSNYPFHKWVPRPVGILVLLMMFVPPTFSGGAYWCNIGEMSGALGIWAEDVQAASIFTSIGMCLFPSFMVRFLQGRRIRHTFLWGFLALIPLNLVCALTTSVPLLLATCLLTGFVRIIVMLNCTFTIAPYLTGTDTLSMFTMKEEPEAGVQYMLERKRTFLMPVLYAFILTVSQACNLLTAWCAYAYRWQDAYLAVVGMLLAAILPVVCTMPGEPRKRTYAVEWQKVPDMLLMAAALGCIAYTLVYGKTLDWLCSSSIRLALGLMLLSCGAFLLRSLRKGEGAYLPLGVFAFRNVWMSMLLFALAMVLNSAGAFIGAFARISTPAGSWHASWLSGWAIVGCVAGLLLSVLPILAKARFRTIFCTAFLLMASANAYLYFQYRSVGLFSHMAIPTVLGYSGLLMLYAVVAAFGMKRLPSRHLATFVFLMIWMRNVIVPTMGYALYTSWQHQCQQYCTSRIARDIHAEAPLAASAFGQVHRMGLAGGKGTAEAGQFATATLGGRVERQAAIVAMRDITGCTVLLLLAAAGITLILPYHKGETT